MFVGDSSFRLDVLLEDFPFFFFYVWSRIAVLQMSKCFSAMPYPNHFLYFNTCTWLEVVQSAWM